MLTHLNDILTCYVLPGLILAFGLCFLFVHVPQDEAGLRGYRMARRMMSYAYLAFFVALVVEAMGVRLEMPPAQQQMLIVAMGIVQAFLFTMALTTLIDVQFFTWQRFGRELSLILLPTALVFAMYHLFGPSKSPLKGDFLPFLFKEESGGVFLLIVFYAGILARYVVLFHRRYTDYKRRMAGYFSGDEWERLRWVRRSFYTAFSFGLLALLYALHPSLLTNLLFTLVLVVYYTVFCLRFVNYAFTFHQIEPAITIDHSPSVTRHPSAPGDIAPEDDARVAGLMSRLASLMTEQCLYTKPDLTIEEVAMQAGESYRNVSAAINTCMGISFRTWVNTYRIERAKRLIAEGYLQDHVMDALAQASGFAGRVSFYRAFKKHTGQSPTDFC